MAVIEFRRAWEEPVPGQVFACLVPGELRILLFPGLGIVCGGAPRDIPMTLVPFELRMPNTKLWVQMDAELNIIRVWRRDEE